MNLVLGQTVVARRYHSPTGQLLFLDQDRPLVGKLATVVELFAGDPRLVRLQFDHGLQVLWAASACVRPALARTCTVCRGAAAVGHWLCPACACSWTALLKREGVSSSALLEPATICRWATTRAVTANNRRQDQARSARTHARPRGRR